MNTATIEKHNATTDDLYGPRGFPKIQPSQPTMVYYPGIGWKLEFRPFFVVKRVRVDHS